MSFRKQQVESTLQRAISTVLARQISDPRIVGMVSVTRISVSPDLHEAQVFVTVLPDKYQKRTIAGLRHATRHIQALVGKSMTMKTMPRLDFRLDETIKKETGVLSAIRRGIEREGPEPETTDPADSDSTSDSDAGAEKKGPEQPEPGAE